MNSRELSVTVAQKLGVTAELSKTMVRAIFAEIESSLVRGEDVEIQGFGRFSSSLHKANGKTITLNDQKFPKKDRWVPYLSASLKDKVTKARSSDEAEKVAFEGDFSE